MIDTVTKILRLADEYANTKQAAAWAETALRRMDPEKIRQMWLDASGARQALETELVRLFTPLTDADCTRIYNEANGITTKNPPISTARIFTAMRAVRHHRREE